MGLELVAGGGEVDEDVRVPVQRGRVGAGPLGLDVEPTLGHVPVLLEKVVGALAPAPGEVYLDCTAGLGGHAAAMAARLGPAGTVVLNDLDASNLEVARARVREVAGGAGGLRVEVIHGNFAEAWRRLSSLGLRADVVLADLGFSSNQVDDASRGFSFMRDGPLDMRLDPSRGVSAAELVRSLPEAELERLVREFGEERWSARVARKIVQARESSPITTTGALADLVRSALGPAASRDSIHPATRTFQALRIAVNDELGSLEALLAAIGDGARSAARGEGWLRTGARVGIISFHSLEDRLVKRGLAGVVESGLASHATRKPIEAEGSEVRVNPRARSAKLRVVRIGSAG